MTGEGERLSRWNKLDIHGHFIHEMHFCYSQVLRQVLHSSCSVHIDRSFKYQRITDGEVEGGPLTYF